MADTSASETPADLQAQFQLTEAETAELIRIENRAAVLFASPEKARLWMTVPLDAFEGKTPLELIKQGQVESTLRYLDSVSVGFSG